jgi:hypothetical protein
VSQSGITLDGSGATFTGASLTVSGANDTLRGIHFQSVDTAITASAANGLIFDAIQTRDVNSGIVCSYGCTHDEIKNSDIQCKGEVCIELENANFSQNQAFGALGSIHDSRIETQVKPDASGGPDGIEAVSGLDLYNNHFVVTTLAGCTCTQHPDMIQWQGNYLRLFNNDFLNVGDSNLDMDTFADTTPHDIRVYDNVFRIVDAIDPYPDFIRLYSSGSKPTSITNVKVMNNVFADSNGGSGIPPVNFCYYQGGCNSPSASGNQITNNIFVNDGDGSTSGAMLSLSGSAGSGWTADHNVYYRSGGGYVTWKGTSYSASSFVQNVDTSGTVTLPAFRSYALHSPTNDFDLLSTDTVAKNSGASLASLFTTDMDGVTRPQGVAWDRGPYEVPGG